jgi:hypothetical protein
MTTTTNQMLTIADHQADMRRAYLWGATGIVTSGVVWLLAGLVAYLRDPQQAVWTLFIGASFIFPVSNLIDRLLGASGKHDPSNPLGRLAMEGTVWMLMCLPAAYVLAQFQITFFFPAVLMVISGRYLTFATIYGTKAYWALSALLGLMAMIGVMQTLSPHAAAFGGAAVEICFGLLLRMRTRGKH